MTPKTEQWRDIVSSELFRINVPLPVDLILGVIWTESRGNAGSTNPKSGASGLMQVMPKTLDWYNKQNPSIPLALLRSTAHGREQIRVGIWVLAQFWKLAYKYLKSRLEEIPTEELAKIADLFYVAGPGATRKKLDKVGRPFYTDVAAKYPNWNALPHTINVFAQFSTGSGEWDLARLSQWLQGAVTKDKTVKTNAFLALGVILLVYWYFLREKKSNEKED